VTVSLTLVFATAAVTLCAQTSEFVADPMPLHITDAWRQKIKHVAIK